MEMRVVHSAAFGTCGHVSTAIITIALGLILRAFRPLKYANARKRFLRSGLMVIIGCRPFVTA